MSLSKKETEKVFDYFSKNINPKSDLEFSSPFELVVAVILSAQSTDKGVNKATRVLFSVANTPQQILELGLYTFREYIKTIGLYKTKSENILKTCRILVEQYDGQVPDTKEELLSLPGIGIKSANVILNVIYGQPTIAVDTHVHRVSNRIGLVQTDRPEKTEKELLKIVPKKHLMEAHHYLVLHGRYTCTARSPKCATCGIREYCQYPDKNL